MTRERQLVETFVEVADTLVDDFDVIDFLLTLAGRCVQLLDVDAAGIMLVDQRGHLHAAAASTESARLVELFELQIRRRPLHRLLPLPAPRGQRRPGGQRRSAGPGSPRPPGTPVSSRCTPCRCACARPSSAR